MKKQIQRLLFLLLMVVAVSGLFPVLTASAATASEVYVGGVRMTSGTYLANGATRTTTTKPSGGYAYFSGGTLTLNNYSYEGRGWEYDTYGEFYSVVYAAADLKVTLTGTNTLTQTAPESDGIYIKNGSLTVSGTGKLNSTGTCYGLHADNSVTINGGTIVSSGTSIGIDCVQGNVTINGGDITANGRWGISSESGSVTINGGKVTAKSTETTNDASFWAIKYRNTFTVANGLKIHASTSASGAQGIYDATRHNTCDLLVVDVLKVYVGGVGLAEGQYLAVGATQPQSTRPSGGYAYFRGDALILNEYSYEGRGLAYLSDGVIGYAVVYADEDLKISLTGTNTLVQTGLGEAIRVECGALTMTGSGSVTCNSSGSGIRADNDIVIDGGTIMTEATSVGILSRSGDITIRAGYVSTSGCDGISTYGNPNGDIIITGGVLIAMSTRSDVDSNYWAVVTGGAFNVADYMKIEASTEPHGTLGAYNASSIRSYDLIVVVEPAVRVNGIGMFDGDYLAEGATQTQTTRPSDGYIWCKDGVLYLNNYEYSRATIQFIEGRQEINITGENTIGSICDQYNTLNGSLSNYNWLVIGGTGSLEITGSETVSDSGYASSIGIKGELIINSGSVEIWDYYSYVIDADAVTVNGGTLITGASQGGILKNATEIRVTGTGRWEMFDAGCWDQMLHDDCTVKAGHVYIGSASRPKAEDCEPWDEYTDLSLYSTVWITGSEVVLNPTVYVGGVELQDGEYLAIGGRSPVTTKPSGGYAYYKTGILYLSNYSYEGKGWCYGPEYNYRAVIYANRNLQINFEGTNTLTQTATNSEGIYVSNGFLTLEGTGTLNCSGTYYGICSDHAVTINSGTIVSQSEFFGICSNGNVTINGGKVTASGFTGIYAGESVIVNSGTLIAKSTSTSDGDFWAIEAGEFVVNNGLKIRAATTPDGTLGTYVSGNHETYDLLFIGKYVPGEVEYVSKVEVKDIEAPVHGNNPDYIGTVGDPELYGFAKYGFDYSGFYWYDSEGVMMTTSDTFVGGETYQLEIKLTRMMDGQQVVSEFKSPVTATLNGKTVSDVFASKDTVYIYYDFVCEGNGPTITTVASGWSGATQWNLTSDGVITFYGSGNMKNYGYNRNQPWLAHADKITSVVIENGVTAIGTGAFMGLTKLESVTLPTTGLKTIGEAAFYGCTSLKEITIPEGIYTIWLYTFKGCTSLAKVKMPKSLIKVDQGAFENCSSLTYVYFPTNVEIIGSWSFKGCTGLTEVDMTWTNATKIREGAFKNCSSLTTIRLPENIQTLGDSCFYGIGAESFTVPDTVTNIEAWCFARAKLTKITFKGNAPTIGEGAFNKITLTAYYPAGNNTWTAAKRVNYGGTVTWKAQ